ncbi:LacI family transcriptional regulator [Saprospiraceae bacterium]|nr:LacI family transcriptional regulator [Saprospiraceae bacterium]
MKNKQATIKDIAKEIGVSPSTVSRALNDHPAISAATKVRIKAKAKELKYEPNIVALSLKNKTTKTIGVVIPELIHFFFSSVISGIEEVAYDNGYTVMVCQSKESHDKEVKDVMALLSHRVDGLLISQAKEIQNNDHYDEIQGRGVPLVFFDRMPSGVKAPSIIIDDASAAQEATQHLIERGCKSIMHLGNNLDMPISKARANGYRRALIESGMDVDEDMILDCPSSVQNDSYSQILALLESGAKFDGLFASNDLLAIGAIKALKQFGLSIPEDVAVVGFSNWNFCDMVDPPLSSVNQSGTEMGRRAMERLLRMIVEDEENANDVMILDTALIVRKSSKKGSCLKALFSN